MKMPPPMVTNRSSRMGMPQPNPQPISHFLPGPATLMPFSYVVPRRMSLPHFLGKMQYDKTQNHMIHVCIPLRISVFSPSDILRGTTEVPLWALNAKLQRYVAQTEKKGRKLRSLLCCKKQTNIPGSGPDVTSAPTYDFMTTIPPRSALEVLHDIESFRQYRKQSQSR